MTRYFLIRVVAVAIGVACCYAAPSAKSQELATPATEPQRGKFRGPDDPERWEWEARIGTRHLRDAVDFDRAMEKVYEAAAAKCPDSEGVDGWFLWLGRVNRNGVITKTHRSSESEFPKCMDSKLLGVKVKRPPKWNQAGYPVMFMYGPVGH